ncbi:MAG: hypothetical protein ACREJY_14745 [Candidatus Rokuibacteriota bacterium]
MTPPRHVIVCGRGVPVTVVERSGVACAASGKSGGFLALDWCDNTPLGPLARVSFALHAELNAPATGLALAELITQGAAASVDLEPFDPARLPAAAGRRDSR